MNLLSGVDLIEIERFDRIEPGIRERFMHRVLTAKERLEVMDSNSTLAGKFAAKEAVVKALGCGIGPVSFQDIEILHNPNGQPILYLYNNARKIVEKNNLQEWSVSISHTRQFAVAIAIFTGE
jgi:holo-[acyl-carrier protein] synthase